MNYPLKYQNYIFDFDGTIADSSGEVLGSLKQAFNEAGIAFDEADFVPEIIGPPIKEIILRVKPDLSCAQLDIVVSHYRNIYDNKENDSSVLYDGMESCLRRLKNNGKRLFISTNKPKIPMQRLIKKFALDMFDDICTIDRFGAPLSKKEIVKRIIRDNALTSEETVMIGDAQGDIDAAAASGIASIFVSWGYCKNKEDVMKNADYSAATVAELEHYL